VTVREAKSLFRTITVLSGVFNWLERGDNEELPHWFNTVIAKRYDVVGKRPVTVKFLCFESTVLKREKVEALSFVTSWKIWKDKISQGKSYPSTVQESSSDWEERRVHKGVSGVAGKHVERTAQSAEGEKVGEKVPPMMGDEDGAELAMKIGLFEGSEDGIHEGEGLGKELLSSLGAFVIPSDGAKEAKRRKELPKKKG